MLIYFALALLISSSSLHAILDGRVAPIYLDTRYTFTDGEWARGIVYFNGGFDVPTQGTAYINLDGGGVYDSINLNSGTLNTTKIITLFGKGSIVGPGFLRATSTTVLYHDSVSQRLFSGIGKIKFIGNWSIEGLSSAASLDQADGCILDFTATRSNIRIAGGTVFWRSILTSFDNPPAFFLVNIDLQILTPIINAELLVFQGINTITAVIPVDIQQLQMSNSGKTKILSGSQIKLRQLSIPFTGTRLELQNASLDFVSSTTGQINIVRLNSGLSQGAISVEGRCSIKSSTINTLWLDSKVDLEFYPGSRLSIEPKTQFSIIDFP